MHVENLGTLISLQIKKIFLRCDYRSELFKRCDYRSEPPKVLSNSNHNFFLTSMQEILYHIVAYSVKHCGVDRCRWPLFAHTSKHVFLRHV